MIAWKRQRAAFKYQLKMYKKKSWAEMTASIKSKTATQNLYEQIRRRKERPPKAMTMILNSRVFRSTTKIINKISNIFRDRSNTRKYSQRFNRIRQIEEQQHLDFSSNNNELYDQEISIYELQRAFKERCSRT